MLRKITDSQLRKSIRDALEQGKKSISVDRGLRLLLDRTPARWEFRSQVAGSRNVRKWIGEYPGKTLAQARAEAQSLYARTLSGENVRRKAQKETARQQARAAAIVADLWPEWWEHHRQIIRPYANEKDYARNAGRWVKHVLPFIGGMRPADIKPRDIAGILNAPAVNGATAIKVLALLRRFLEWCANEAGLLPEDARLPTEADRLRPLLTKRKPERRHQPMCPVADVPRFIAALVAHARFREPDSAAAMGLMFSILTASRSGNIERAAGKNLEAVSWAQWRDVAGDLSTLTLPADKMKEPLNGDHVIPLVNPCVRILRRLEALGMRGRPLDPVFPGVDGDALSSGALLSVIKAVDRADRAAGGTGFNDPKTGQRITQHGTARASFRSWAEETEQNMEVAEQCLHHRKADQYKGAYARGDTLAARRRILDEWARFCLSACPVDWDSA